MEWTALDPQRFGVNSLLAASAPAVRAFSADLPRFNLSTEAWHGVQQQWPERVLEIT